MTTFASAGSRTGNGAVALSLATGPRLAYVISDLSGVQAVSNLVHFRVTSTTEAVQYECVVAVRDAIRALALTGVTSANVTAQKFAWNTLAISPGIFVCPFQERVSPGLPGSNQRSDISYPVQVVFVRKSNRDLDSDFNSTLLWREQVRRAMLLPRSNSVVTAVSEVYAIEVEMGPVFDWAAFGAMYDVGSMTVRCKTREPLTVT